MKRYEIRWAKLDPVEGSEMGKTRPVVIVSMDVFNARSRTVTICPITSKLHPHWRSRLQIVCAGRPAEIAVDQIRTVATNRIGPLVERLSRSDAEQLRQIIAELYAQA